MHPTKTENLEEGLEQEYHVSRVIIAYKFLLGLIESFSGVGIIIWGGKAYEWYRTFIATELTEDPHDVVAQLAERVIPNLLMHHTYLALTLILLGVAKVAGSIGLMRQQNWGVDLLVGLTIVMFPFQLVSIILHPAVFDLIYFLIGLFIALYLINFKPKAWISKVVYKAKYQLERLKS